MKDFVFTMLIGILFLISGFLIGAGMWPNYRMANVASGEVTIQVDHAPDIIYTCEIRREG